MKQETVLSPSTLSRTASRVRSTRPRHALGVVAATLSWVLLLTAVLYALLLAGWVLLGVVLVGRGPAPASSSVFSTVPALLLLAGLLAWLIARFFSSWCRVGRVAGLTAGLVLAAGVAGAIAAPGPALFLAREMACGDSNVGTYMTVFPSHPLHAAPAPYTFAVAPDPRVGELFARLAGAGDWNSFVARNDTQAFLVIRDGQVVYESYFNQTRRDTLVTSFSMAKSFTSALVGAAVQDGYIHSVDDPVTRYLPELAQRDPRFKAITIRNLLMMNSGLDYQANRSLVANLGDDPLTTYYPDQRWLALENTRIVTAPGQTWLYNKYHPQLLGMILERTTGMPVTRYLQTRLWDPLGMEYGGSWSIDSQKSDFEKMEAGVNARAIDFAKFGELFLNGGTWRGRQVLSKAWVDESTRPYLPANTAYYPQRFATPFGQMAYGLMWWGITRPDGGYDFYAAGDHGQYIYVSPAKHLVIVRNGLEYGLPSSEWLQLFHDFAGQY